MVAGGTLILSPFKGLALSVTWIVPPVESMVCEVVWVFCPVAMLMWFGVVGVGLAVGCAVVNGVFEG